MILCYFLNIAMFSQIIEEKYLLWNNCQIN